MAAHANRKGIEKVCTRCGITKALTDYSPDPRRKDGRYARCRPCIVAVNTEWNRAHPEIAAARRRAGYPKRVPYLREWNRANAERRRACSRKRKLMRYGLTPESFSAMLSAQGGACTACGGPPDGNCGKLNVDHDHETGLVRGLLCFGCNTALGLMQESVDRMEKLIAYLVRHNKQERRTA